MSSVADMEKKMEELEKRMDTIEEMEKSQACGDAEELKKENEALRAENEELKIKLEKDEYRIKHLIRSLEEEEKKEEVIERLNYRIRTLVRSLNVAEGRPANEDLKALPASAKPKVEESDPFWGVDLVVGRIVKAWKHEKADKLICEVIDCGEAFGGERKIASGLFLFYRPEDLEGKLVVVVANLKEKPLVGYPSHGMVLCACKEDHSAVQVLEPPEDAVPGMKITLEGLPASTEATKEINLRSKSNKWDAAQPELRVDANGEAVYKGYYLTVNGKHLKAASLTDVPLS
ncbi:hypothetical protein WA577_002169 [Blastocystis sp. JDR]